jgi:tetratricopeptide (TPR) repeat protein
VLLPDGRHAQVDIAAVDLPPRAVLAPAGLALSEQPREAAPTHTAGPQDSEREVVDMRWVQGQTWYRLASDGAASWVPAWRVRARRLLQAVHFVAGLYRYQLGRWDDAVREFDLFTRSPGVEEDNLSLSTAYQLLGASRLMAASKAYRLPQATGWQQDYANALRQTPQDASIYALRGVAELAVRRKLDAALGDFAQALRLDPGQGDAQQALRALDASARQGAGAQRLRMLGLPPATDALRQRLEALALELQY